jgi:hypothetical protein
MGLDSRVGLNEQARKMYRRSRSIKECRFFLFFTKDSGKENKR